MSSFATRAATPACLQAGAEHLIDAHGCDPRALRSLAALQQLFDAVIVECALHPVQPPVWHVFPGEAGITGIVLLSESHLAIHTYPETGLAAINLYCCRPRDTWPWAARLGALLGATDVRVRTVVRG